VAAPMYWRACDVDIVMFDNGRGMKRYAMRCDEMQPGEERQQRLFVEAQ
jgi:hypothetical protein